MPFDKDLMPPKAHPDVHAYASKCRGITPGAGDQITPSGTYFTYFMASESCQVNYTAYQDDDSTSHTVSLLPGQVLPGRVRRIISATAPVLGWYD